MTTYCKDVDLMIIMELDDKSLFNFCLTSKRGNNLCDENFWRNRLWKYYSKIYPEEGQKWKELYLKLVYYMNKYKYTMNSDYGIRRAIFKGRLEVVKYLISKGFVDPSVDNNYAIKYATNNGYLGLVKYLISTGLVDPSSDDNYAIKRARNYGHLKIFKYFLSLPKEYGVKI